MLKEFREFIMRGNMLDLAVGVIIGAAFGAIITSLVNDILMPPIGLALGNVSFTDLFIDLSGGNYATLADAQAAAAPTINYGNFIQALINFLIIAFVIFLIIRSVNRLKRKGEPGPAVPSTKICPYCVSNVPLTATRCAFCTSELPR